MWPPKKAEGFNVTDACAAAEAWRPGTILTPPQAVRPDWVPGSDGDQGQSRTADTAIFSCVFGGENLRDRVDEPAIVESNAAERSLAVANAVVDRTGLDRDAAGGHWARSSAVTARAQGVPSVDDLRAAFDGRGRLAGDTAT